jgi:hypothetical protein
MRLELLYSSIPVLFVGLVVTYLLFLTGCGGIVEIYLSFFLTALLALYVVGFYLYSIATYFDKRKPINLRPALLTLLIVGLIVLVSYLDSEQFKSEVILKASNDEPYRTIDIRLRANNEIEFYYGHIEEKCSCKGTFELKGDTIQIIEIEKTEKFEPFDRYLITASYVIPIKGNILELDTTKFLRRFGDAIAR